MLTSGWTRPARSRTSHEQEMPPSPVSLLYFIYFRARALRVHTPRECTGRHTGPQRPEISVILFIVKRKYRRPHTDVDSCALRTRTHRPRGVTVLFHHTHSRLIAERDLLKLALALALPGHARQSSIYFSFVVKHHRSASTVSASNRLEPDISVVIVPGRTSSRSSATDPADPRCRARMTRL